MKKFTTLKKVYKVKTMQTKRFAYVERYVDIFGFSTPYVDGFSDLFMDCINILNELKLR